MDDGTEVSVEEGDAAGESYRMSTLEWRPALAMSGKAPGVTWSVHGLDIVRNIVLGHQRSSSTGARADSPLPV